MAELHSSTLGLALLIMDCAQGFGWAFIFVFG